MANDRKGSSSKGLFAGQKGNQGQVEFFHCQTLKERDRFGNGKRIDFLEKDLRKNLKKASIKYKNPEILSRLSLKSEILQVVSISDHCFFLDPSSL